MVQDNEILEKITLFIKMAEKPILEGGPFRSFMGRDFTKKTVLILRIEHVFMSTSINNRKWKKIILVSS